MAIIHLPPNNAAPSSSLKVWTLCQRPCRPCWAILARKSFSEGCELRLRDMGATARVNGGEWGGLLWKVRFKEKDPKFIYKLLTCLGEPCSPAKMMELSCPYYTRGFRSGSPKDLAATQRRNTAVCPTKVNQGNTTYKGPAMTLVWPQERKQSRVGVVRQGPHSSYCDQNRWHKGR